MYFDTLLEFKRLLFVTDYESYNAGRRIKAKRQANGGEEGNFGGFVHNENHVYGTMGDTEAY